jgi:hypothetical protein
LPVSGLDPGTLTVRASVAVPCNFLASTFVAFDDAIWFLDRTTADIDAHGGRLRRIDLQTNEITGDVVVPFVNGYLSASPEALFWLGQPSLSSRPEDVALYRLLPGEAALTSLGPPDGLSLYPVGEGVWVRPQSGGPAVLRSSPGAPDQAVAIGGALVGADESGLYVSQISTFDSTPELWRYPTDGSAPERLALGVTLQTANRRSDPVLQRQRPAGVRPGIRREAVADPGPGRSFSEPAGHAGDTGS